MPQTDMSKRPLPRKSRTKGSQKTENWLEITAKGPPRGKEIASQILIDTKKFDWKVTSYPCAGGDWTEKWKRWIRPVNVCGVFLVKPSWRRVAEDGRVVIEIDPGMAFGTGTHPSTRLYSP
jgi:ribosomal protein L11 methylase PrmA